MSGVQIIKDGECPVKEFRLQGCRSGEKPVISMVMSFHGVSGSVYLISKGLSFHFPFPSLTPAASAVS